MNEGNTVLLENGVELAVLTGDLTRRQADFIKGIIAENARLKGVIDQCRQAADMLLVLPLTWPKVNAAVEVLSNAVYPRLEDHD